MLARNPRWLVEGAVLLQRMDACGSAGLPCPAGATIETGRAVGEAELDVIAVRGIPMLDELAFLHRATRTLILTDLCFNIQHSDSFITRLAMRINSAYGRFGPSRMLRWVIKDKAALRAAIDRLLEWDFDRVVVTHGDVVETGGREALRGAYAWLSV